MQHENGYAFAIRSGPFQRLSPFEKTSQLSMSPRISPTHKIESIRSQAVEEEIYVLRRLAVNASISVNPSNPKLQEPRPFERMRSFKKFCFKIWNNCRPKNLSSGNIDEYLYLRLSSFSLEEIVLGLVGDKRFMHDWYPKLAW
ncbi:hypothetical protein SADUNF_Sadunf01G0002000 [Salix dunnii]|uniref:Uncharacterized protein n=1 Tax=Salix dunnii TaxID=1413687 RepID=A0A835N968_9ROSI|nr:hypothetical protein SADUNF_Sadunf01G0002000 [Salix dunnii]